MMRERMRVLLVLLAAAATITAVAGTISCEYPSGVQRQVDEVFADWDSTTTPGAALGVIREGELVYARGYGMADLEHRVPITPQSVFRIGSTSKQFTAFCVALLADEGLLSLDDDIDDYFPEFPDYPEPITVRQLIHHTSGIRDYLMTMMLAGKRDADWYTDQEVVAMLARQQQLNFPPGSEHLYSNSGYFLLARLIRRLTGRTLREFADERIFQPLGMTDTHYHDRFHEVVPDRAVGYAPDPEDGYRISTTTLEMVGDGGVFTTVEDLAKWDRNFYTHEVGGEAIQELIHTTGTLEDGSELEYAFGLVVSDYRGLTMVSHGGSFVGYRAEMIRFPDPEFTVIVLANRADANPTRRALEVADIYLADVFPEPKEEPAAGEEEEETGEEGPEQRLTLYPEHLALYAGDYYSPELDATYRIRMEDDTLHVSVGRSFDFPMQWEEEDVFSARFMTFRFRKDARGRITGFRLDAGRARDFGFRRR